MEETRVHPPMPSAACPLCGHSVNLARFIIHWVLGFLVLAAYLVGLILFGGGQ